MASAKSPYHKLVLTERMRRIIRTAHENGSSQALIARRFGIPRMLVEEVFRGKRIK